MRAIRIGVKYAYVPIRNAYGSAKSMRVNDSNKMVK